MLKISTSKGQKIHESRNQKSATDLSTWLERSQPRPRQERLYERRYRDRPAFPTANGIDAIISLYADFLSKLDFNVQFDLLELELRDDLGFIRTHSHGTIVPKGQKPAGSEGNREIFIVKKIQRAWKFYRYIFNSEVAS